MKILFDIDDTLVKNEKYPDNFNNIKKLIDVLKKKVSFGVCTYRPYDKNVRKICANYGINGPIITEGGAYYLDLNIIPLNVLLKDIISSFLKENNIDVKVSVSSNYKNIKTIIINKDRKKTATIRFPKKMYNKIDLIINYIKNKYIMNDMNITKSYNDELKVNIFPKNINKISAIEKFFPNERIIFITDYEYILPKHNSLISVYSVGSDLQFNKNCDKTFSLFGEGIEEILMMLRSEIMKNYEHISKNCKMLWKEGFEVTTEKYTQVSGYIFDDNNQLLIVKNEDMWTIPGGHPELYETSIGTLIRELMEEACVSLKNIKYMGAVEVVEEGKTYYQMRYTARIKEVFSFREEYEISERKFVDLSDLKHYITWADGITFVSQIDLAKKIWGIL